jgi:hypothetical protein
MSDLRPCPWNCKRAIEITRMIGSERYSLLHRCPVVGPISFTEETAEACVAAWNHRPNGGAIRPGSDTNSPIVETASCKSCGKQTAYRCPWDHVYICGEIACREKHEEVGECRRVSP